MFTLIKQIDQFFPLLIIKMFHQTSPTCGRVREREAREEKWSPLTRLHLCEGAKALESHFVCKHTPNIAHLSLSHSFSPHRQEGNNNLLNFIDNHTQTDLFILLYNTFSLSLSVLSPARFAQWKALNLCGTAVLNLWIFTSIIFAWISTLITMCQIGCMWARKKRSPLSCHVHCGESSELSLQQVNDGMRMCHREALVLCWCKWAKKENLASIVCSVQYERMEEGEEGREKMCEGVFAYTLK